MDWGVKKKQQPLNLIGKAVEFPIFIFGRATCGLIMAVVSQAETIFFPFAVHIRGFCSDGERVIAAAASHFFSWGVNYTSCLSHLNLVGFLYNSSQR